MLHKTEHNLPNLFLIGSTVRKGQMIQSVTSNLLSACIWIAASVAALPWLVAQELPTTTMSQRLSDRVIVDSERDQNGKIEFGRFLVYEDRSKQTGRILKLEFAILYANGDYPKPDPIFFLAGGPGVAASQTWQQFVNAWQRTDRDIVLLSQRGTSGSNRLDIKSSKTDDLQSLINPVFDTELIRRAMQRLEKRADLTMYSTPMAMDDLDDFRKALGYENINISGGSYGTRAALVYIRQHGESVRTAILNGVAPIAFRNPLYHAREAQRAVDLLFDEVESNATYTKAFPGLREKFQGILTQLEKQPAEAKVRNSSGKEQTVSITRDAFVNSLRFQLYFLNTNRLVPIQIWRAAEGDFRPFAENAIQRNRTLDDMIALGMLFCVTAAEDVARIRPEEIETLTAGTFLGDGRVRRQLEICSFWPKSKLPENFADPVFSQVPTLILSGQYDPVTPPSWGELVHQNFKNSLHIVAPAAHGVGGPCIDRIEKAFLESGTVENLDISCVEKLKLPPLFLPKEFATER